MVADSIGTVAPKGAQREVAEWIAEVRAGIVDRNIEGDCDGQREGRMVARRWWNECATRRKRRRSVPGRQRRGSAGLRGRKNVKGVA